MKLFHTKEPIVFNHLEIPMPQKKEFKAMSELLRDAEKYDNAGEKEISKALLTDLCEYIQRLK